MVSVSPTSSLTTTTAPAGPKARSEPGLLRGFRPGRWGRRRPERSLCLLPCPSSPPSASRLINLCPMPSSVSWLQSVTHPSEGTFGGSACARAHVPGRGTLSLADPVSGRAKGSGVQLPSPEAPARPAAVAGKQQTKLSPPVCSLARSPPTHSATSSSASRVLLVRVQFPLRPPGCPEPARDGLPESLPTPQRSRSLSYAGKVIPGVTTDGVCAASPLALSVSPTSHGW